MRGIESVRAVVPVGEVEIPVVAPDQVMAGTLGVPTDQKLGAALRLMGCDFWDDDNRFVRDPAVSLVGIGGVPVARADETAETIANRINYFTDGSRITMEFSSFLSYLNPADKPPGELYEKVTGLGHLSIAHAVSVNVLVAGATTAVECEFDTQRDLVASGRTTVARTSIQTNPPIVAPNEQSLAAAARIMDATRSILSAVRSDKPNRDEHEIYNRLFPAAKATEFMLSGSLRNFGKLVDQREDPGKEAEYRDILHRIHGILGGIWPEIFKRT